MIEEIKERYNCKVQGMEYFSQVDDPGVMRMDIQTLLSELEKAEIKNRILQKGIDRWVPCPDHRDKVHEGCYVCKLEKAEERVKALTEAVEKLAILAHREHLYDDDDCWFSCYAHPDCCNENSDGKCNCGADKHNSEIKKVLEEVKGRPK